jgi:hypothetical protein
MKFNKSQRKTFITNSDKENCSGYLNIKRSTEKKMLKQQQVFPTEYKNNNNSTINCSRSNVRNVYFRLYNDSV